MYYGGDSISWCETRKIVEKCDELTLMRSRTNDKEEFVRYVMCNIFGSGAVDLLLMPAGGDGAEATKRLNGLIGFESSVFKIIYTNDAIFDEFLRHFTQHAISSRASPAEARGSIYMWLLMEYLLHILPVDDAKLHVLKNNNWLAAPFRPSSAPQCVSSPRKLLRPEVIAASSPLDYGVRSASLRGVYPRLVQFLGGLVGQLASLNAWPSLAQCTVLRAILAHYVDFMLRETDDSDFVSLKFLLNKRSLFVVPLQQFVQRLLVNWPLNTSYVELIDLWMTLTHHAALEARDRERRRQFIELSARHFVGHFELIVQRLIDADCSTLLVSGVLDVVEQRVLEKPHCRRLFTEFGMPTIDYVTAVGRKLTLFRDEQRRLAAGVGAADGFGVKLGRFLASLFNGKSNSVDAAEYHIQRLQRLLDDLTRNEDGQRMPHCRSIIGGEDEEDVGGPSASTPIDDPTASPSSAAGGVTTTVGAWTPSPITTNNASSRSSSFRSWLHADQPAVTAGRGGGGDAVQPAMPDHDVDPWTKLFYLTPTGRNQVINRHSNFDFKSCSKQIAATFPYVTRWEIPVMARWMHDLSVRYTNCGLAKWLRLHRNDSLLTKKVAGVLLTAPSPPRYVPVFSRTVPRHPSRLNLRLLANVPFLISLYIALYLCFLLLKWMLF